MRSESKLKPKYEAKLTKILNGKHVSKKKFEKELIECYKNMAK